MRAEEARAIRRRRRASWDLGDPELAVAGTLYHGFEWVFVRVAPALLLAAAAAALFVRKRTRWRLLERSGAGL